MVLPSRVTDELTPVISHQEEIKMNHTLVRHLIPSRQPRGMGFVLLVLLLLVATALTAGSAPSVQRASTHSHWIGTWSTSPMPPDLSGTSTIGFDNQTLRLIVHTSVAGTALRLRLANTFGTAPLTIGQVDVADQLQGASIVSGSDHQLTFGGSPSVTIPTRAEVFSDPLAFQVHAQQNVSVSLYVPQPTGATTWHALSWQT